MNKQKPVWTPKDPEKSNIHNFFKTVYPKNSDNNATINEIGYIEEYRKIHNWSCENYETFWLSFKNWARLPITQKLNVTQVVSGLKEKQLGDLEVQWFPQSFCNYAEWILSSSNVDFQIHSIGTNFV